MTHLWEASHPYYCSEGNFYVGGTRWHEVHSAYESWADFIDDWGDADSDMNLVFRWDWKRADPDDYEDGEEFPPDRLFVYWVLQRKAILRSTECVVTEDDEPAVLAWLTERARTLIALWSPLALAAEQPSGGAR
ncbi:hypothetical protein [Acrocarpospora sp. B8E8]|uniref:hypothetical protein n=1 Tax=Acrocarpospora sp. B8E8 TaxID=3153572 RepID=UPI00325CF767